MKNISLSVDEQTIERMKKRSEQLEMTYSAYIRWLVREDWQHAKSETELLPLLEKEAE